MSIKAVDEAACKEPGEVAGVSFIPGLLVLAFCSLGDLLTWPIWKAIGFMLLNLSKYLWLIAYRWTA